MANETTIPALPCASITETVDFYVALGFELTYQQERPNNYACVKYEDIELHFFSMKDYEPANSYTTCLVLVHDVEAIHQTFKLGLKTALGKVPVAGIPRLTRPNNNNAGGDYRFNVVDPGGNWVRFIQRNSTIEQASRDSGDTTTLSRALKASTILVDAKGDFAGAARILDKALASSTDESAVTRLKAQVLRAEIALNLDEPDLARSLLHDIEQISMSEDTEVELKEWVQRAEELQEMLS